MNQNSAVRSAQKNQVHLNACRIHCRNNDIILTDNACIEGVVLSIICVIDSAPGNHIADRKVVTDLMNPHCLQGFGITDRLSRRKKSLLSSVMSCLCMRGSCFRIQNVHIIGQILQSSRRDADNRKFLIQHGSCRIIPKRKRENSRRSCRSLCNLCALHTGHHRILCVQMIKAIIRSSRSGGCDNHAASLNHNRIDGYTACRLGCCRCLRSS